MSCERKPAGYWKNLENCVAEAREAMRKEGWTALPCKNALAESGYASLANAITKHQGGMCRFRKLFGEEPREREKGIWKDRDYAIRQAQEAMNNEGWTTLPNANVLKERGYSALVDAISAYHQGFHRFRKKLGQNPLIRKKGLWKDLAYAVRQAKNAMRRGRWRRLPSERVLQAHRHGTLVYAIHKYHGGMHRFREQLGQQQLIRESGCWKDRDYVLRQAREAMRKEQWTRFPGMGILRKAGYSSLGDAISNYHRGFPAFRQLLMERTGVNPGKDQLENLLKKYANGAS